MSVMLRFWKFVRKDGANGCWRWIGTKSGGSWVGHGYGQLWHNGRMRNAHRVSWELHHGVIPAGLCVLHKCDVPECVNPNHLFLGTHADNAHDRDGKGRTSKGDKHFSHTRPELCLRGEKHGMTKLTEAQMRAIEASGLPRKELAAQFGVSKATVANIKRHKTWRHLWTDGIVPTAGQEESK